MLVFLSKILTRDKPLLLFMEKIELALSFACVFAYGDESGPP